jgi:hypothetical protein
MSMTIAKRSKKSNTDEIIMRLQKENNQLRNSVELIATKMIAYEENLRKMQEEMESLKTEKRNNSIKYLRKEMINMDTDIVKKKLKKRNIRSICDLMEIYYNKKYPIKCLSRFKYQYFNDGVWINDYNAEITIDTLFDNFEKVFLRINTLDNYDTDNFLNNQKFIYSLNKMKPKFRNYLRNMLEIAQSTR